MPDKSLIRKYLDGRATEEEAKAVVDYLASDDADPRPLQECFEALPDAGPDVTGDGTGVSTGEVKGDGTGHIAGDVILRENVLAALRQQLYPGLAGELTAQTKPVGKVVLLDRARHGRYAIAVAAALLIVVGSALLFKFQKAPLPPEGIAGEWKTLRNGDIRTRLGILPDGSQFYLSPNSTLSYATDFSGHRAIRLEGEAFFDVAHDDRHPFEVQTGRITTQVLGTAFNIEAYKEERMVRVSLVSGRVAVREGALFRVLQAGEALTCYKDSDSTSSEALKINSVTEWENGYTLFNEVPVPAALGRIARQYGFTLHIQGGKELESKHITGVFKQQPLTQILDIILFISQYKYRIRGNTLDVFP
jgi:transmembrane sensor